MTTSRVQSPNDTRATRTFPAGSFYINMAQPMANATFYYLELQYRDGFVGWHVLDDALKELGAGDAGTNGKPPIVYPIFKVRHIINTKPR